ncbi:MAG: PDZ domain-containing protein [Candidatus Vogelbacteria bacterium]|nr:PDZ domain-containing protein [Candidatus Vogelbacteria bacterium]
MQKIFWRFVLPCLFIVALAGAFITGVLLGYADRPAIKQITSLVNQETGRPAPVDFSPFWRAWQIVDEKHIDNVSTTTTKRVWGAIAGMVDALGDPYTVFLPPVEKKNFEESVSGQFGGIGIEIDLRNKILTVISALPETPARIAGLKPKDLIIKINEQSATNLSLEEAVSLIRGEIGTIVKLTIAREGEKGPLEFNLRRANIVIPTIKTELSDNVFLIRLFSFSAQASASFRNALREFVAAGTDKLIIDLRGNPGGLLEAAVDLASWFLPVGEPVVMERGRGGETEKIHRSYGYDIFTEELKLAILVDGGSASAAEILAGALSEYDRAILVGEKTFGKGSVQELVNVTDDSSIKITVAKWYTPKGVSISDNGLTPSVIVERGKDETEDKDSQLLKAIEILKQ